MNTKTHVYAIIIAGILILIACLVLSSCAPKPEGKVLGHGWDGSNYYLMIETSCGRGCVEGLPYEVSKEDYETYKTGDFYDADN